MGIQTLEVIRFVENFIIRIDEVENITISKGLIEFCKASHTRYQYYLSGTNEDSE